MRLLILDNYDSFTYNLVHQVRELGCDFDVIRNDKITIEEAAQYDKFLLSPGPGIPDEAAMLKPLIKTYANSKAILGVCLGHQAIGEVFGAELSLLDKVYHGLATEIEILNKKGVFIGLEDKITVGRYHSWIINKSTLPEELEIIAIDEKAEIMAIQHKEYNVCGVQFHPESILTPLGFDIVRNFIEAE